MINWKLSMLPRLAAIGLLMSLTYTAFAQQQVVQDSVIYIPPQETETNNDECPEGNTVCEHRKKKAEEQTDTPPDSDTPTVNVEGKAEATDTEWKSINIKGEKPCRMPGKANTDYGALGGSDADCTEYTKATKHQRLGTECHKKYPATATLEAAFRDKIGDTCYSCPTNFDRSANILISANDACIQRTLKAKAEYLGKTTTDKPSKNAFKDPRKGGEWWKCPDNRPRRTAHSVTSDKACATEKVIGEKLAAAKFLGKVNNPKPAGAFVDPRKGGEYWKCPKGYKRSAAAVNKPDACIKDTGSVKTAPATRRGDAIIACPANQFGQNGFCYSCPTNYVPTGQSATGGKACRLQEPAELNMKTLKKAFK
ncbi:hypothetical protein [Pseudomaricurvus sp. HS19]|uniref:hypothetical protein n=1 Tax=Pseudomaricurvus sp. HS19 TaxID=2692626 RepID=UPI00137083CD|nr:hypothetical protein [Pseudomaricurvus sp. HS19]MYM62684.1 hypothetical protein [Pseudomaricurvus sp. HS19]